MKNVAVVLNNGVELSTVIVGVMTGVLVAIAAVLVAQWFKNRRWNAQELSAANVARADRLRVIYGRMAQAAVSLRNVRAQRRFTFGNESRDQQNERQLRDIREAVNHVAEVGGLIIIESSAQSVARAYSDVASSIDLYIVQERDLPPGTDRADALRALADLINTRTDEVIKLATEHLNELSRPAQVTMFRVKGSTSDTHPTP
jgi:hypothetical protein